MIQFSVYTKIFANRDSSQLEKIQIRKIAPDKGNIRIMIVTEAQYSKMDIIIGGQSEQERILTEDNFLII